MLQQDLAFKEEDEGEEEEASVQIVHEGQHPLIVIDNRENLLEWVGGWVGGWLNECPLRGRGGGGLLTKVKTH